MKRRWPTIFGCDPPRLTPAWRYLPHRKRSADIVGRCAEYTEGEAAANKAEQHGRFHAIDLLPVDVRLVGEVGHGSSPCNTLPALSPSNYLAICIGAVTGVTQKASPLGEHAPIRGFLGPTTRLR